MHILDQKAEEIKRPPNPFSSIGVTAVDCLNILGFVLIGFVTGSRFIEISGCRQGGRGGRQSRLNSMETLTGRSATNIRARVSFGQKIRKARTMRDNAWSFDQSSSSTAASTQSRSRFLPSQHGRVNRAQLQSCNRPRRKRKAAWLPRMTSSTRKAAGNQTTPEPTRRASTASQVSRDHAVR